MRQLAQRCCQFLPLAFKKLHFLFWQQSIRSRIFIIALLPTLLTAGLLTAQLTRQNIAETEYVLRSEVQSAARHMAAASEYALISGNAGLLQLTVERERNQDKLQFGCVQDAVNIMHYCSGTPGFKPSSPPPGMAGVVKMPGTWLAAYPITLPEIEMENDFPATSQPGPQVIGYALAGVSTAPLQASRRKALQIAAILIATALSLTALLAWRLSTNLTRRIQDVSQAVGRIAGGRLRIRVKVEPSTELGALESGINQMAEALQTHQEELQIKIQHATADLAARKEEAERANTAKSKFFAAASHDLRQPLHALGLFGEALKQQVHTQELTTLANQISNSIASLENLLNALLDVSRLEAGAIEVRTRHFPASQVFDHIKQQFEGPATAKGLRLTVRPSNWILNTDPILLERILINLVSNALRYTKRGRVLVAGRRRGHSLLIQVWDTGVGIPAKEIGSIFEEYVQLNNPDREREKGLGLGLAIVSRTAKLLGLRVSVRSRPGQGSVFGVTVPLGSTQQIAPLEATQPIAISGGLQGQLAALVDDETPILNAMEILFETWGVDIVAGHSADETLDLLELLGRQPDFLITDYSLPGDTNGIEVALRFREKYGADLPVLVLTGDTTADTLQHINQSGFRVINKPVRPARLRAALNHLLETDATVS